MSAALEQPRRCDRRVIDEARKQAEEKASRRLRTNRVRTRRRRSNQKESSLEGLDGQLRFVQETEEADRSEFIKNLPVSRLIQSSIPVHNPAQLGLHIKWPLEEWLVDGNNQRTVC